MKTVGGVASAVRAAIVLAVLAPAVCAQDAGDKPKRSPADAPGGATVVCFGDSTTAPRGKLVVYADRLRGELPKRGIAVRVVNSGVGGSHTDDARRRFANDVLAHRPDLVVIQFGINDSAVDVWRDPPATKPRVSKAKYVANLEFFVDTLRAQKTSVILMTPNPLRWTEKTRQLYGKPPYEADETDGFNVLLKDYAEAARGVARRKGVELIDVYARYESYEARPDRSIDALLLDGMHPNAQGQRLVAELLLEKAAVLLKASPGSAGQPAVGRGGP